MQEGDTKRKEGAKEIESGLTDRNMTDWKSYWILFWKKDLSKPNLTEPIQN